MSAAASAIEIGGFLASVLRRIKRGLDPDPVDAEVAVALDVALGAAVRRTDLTPDAQETVFAGLRQVLFELSDEALTGLLGGEVPNEFNEIGGIDPHLGQLVDDFATGLMGELRTRAAQLGNPLFNSSVLSTLDRVAAGVRDIYAAVMSPEAELNVERLPPGVGRRLQALAGGQRESALRMAAWVGEPADRAENLRHLMSDPPSWLDTEDRAVLEIVAELAVAHGLRDVAKEAYSRLARVDERPSWRFFWRARAAEHDDEAEGALTDLRANAPDRQAEALTECFIALVRQEPGDLVANADEAMGMNEAADLIVSSLKAQALRASGSLDAAIELLERLVNPDRSGIALVLAESLTVRATSEHPPNRTADASRALDLALEALRVRREWGGASGDAVLIACQAAAAMDDWQSVRRIGSNLYGDATADEAATPGVAELVGFADLVLSGTAGDALHASPSGQAWLRGLALDRTDDQRPEAQAAFAEAVALADGILELERSLRGLAVLGVHPLPRLEELAAEEPGHAAALDALARYRASGDQAALAELRLLARDVRMAAGFVVNIESEIGDARTAARIALDTARRLDEPQMFPMAVALLIDLDPEEADRVAAAALEELPPQSPVRRDLRLARVTIAVGSGDPQRILASATAALAEGSDEPGLQWLIVQAHLATNNGSAAWGYIDSAGLWPESEHQAHLYLNAHAAGAPSTSARGLDVMDAFEHSHDVLAHGLLLFFGRDHGPEDDASPVEEVGRRYGAHVERFTNTFPDSTAIRAIRIDPEDPESIIAALEAEMPTLPAEAEKALERLYRHVDLGDIPVGALAAVLNRDALSVMVAGANRSVPTVPDDRRLSQELDAARAALGRDLVVDVSTLAALSLTPVAWDHVVAVSARLCIPSSQRQEVGLMASQARAVAHTVRTPDGLRFAEVSEADRDAIDERFAWMRRRAGEISQELPRPLSPLGPLGDLEAEGTWAHAMQLARALDRPLLCDDVGLAEMARSAGITAFGSFALIWVASEAGAIPPGSTDRFVADAFSRQVVDLPITASSLVTVADSLGWPPGPVLSHISRPAYWRGPGATEHLDRIIQEVLGADRAMLGTLCGAVVNGAGRAVPAHAAPGFVIAVALKVLFSARVQAHEFPTFIAALREGWRAPDDPLIPLARELRDVVAEAHPADVATEFVMSLAADMDGPDREKVAASLLDG